MPRRHPLLRLFDDRVRISNSSKNRNNYEAIMNRIDYPLLLHSPTSGQEHRNVKDHTP